MPARRCDDVTGIAALNSFYELSARGVDAEPRWISAVFAGAMSLGLWVPHKKPPSKGGFSLQ